MIFQTLVLAASICLPIGKELGYSEKIYGQSKSLSFLATETFNYEKAGSYPDKELERIIEKGFIDCDSLNKNRDDSIKDNVQKYFFESGKKDEVEAIEKNYVVQGLIDDKGKEKFDNDRLAFFDLIFDFESALRKEGKFTYIDNEKNDDISYDEVETESTEIEEIKEKGRDYITEIDNLDFDKEKAIVISGGYLDGKPFNGYILSADFCRLVFNTIADFFESVLKTTLSAFGIYAILQCAAPNLAAIIATVASKIGAVMGSLLSHLFAIPYVGPILFALLIVASVGAALVLAKIIVAAYFGYGFAIGFKGRIWTFDLEWTCNLAVSQNGKYGTI